MGVHKIVAHRETHRGLEFLTQWEGAPPSHDSWVEMKDFIQAAPAAWIEYCHLHHLRLET